MATKQAEGQIQNKMDEDWIGSWGMLPRGMVTILYRQGTALLNTPLYQGKVLLCIV